MKDLFDPRHSIQFKLTLSFLIILIPLVIVSVFSNYYSQQILNEQITDRTHGALLTTLEYIDELTKNIDQLTLWIGANPNLIDIWREIEDPLSHEHLYDIYMIQKQLSALSNVNGAVKDVFIIHGHSGKGVSTRNGGLQWPNVMKEFWFQQTLGAGGGLVVYTTPSKNEELSHYLPDDQIYYARTLDVFDRNEDPNIMVLAVDKSSLQSILQHLQTTPNTHISLFYNETTVLGGNETSEFNDQLFSITADSGSWSIRMEQPHSELFALSRQLQQLTYLIIGISILLALWIGWFVFTRIAKPIQKLLGAFKQFSGGNLSARIIHWRKDELGNLMDEFNWMAEEQSRMIEEDYKKQLRIARSELNLLQSQINPHFLYNTLDSIYSVAIKNKVVEISEMVINLAHFFRASLGKGEVTFTLEETMDHLMYYIRVQQIRTDHFSVDIELEDQSKEIPVLRLILQPIVENAIIHGLSRSAEHGMLRIRSHVVKKQLHIFIEDRGIGIDEEKLQAIQHDLNKITSDSFLNSEDQPFSQFFGLKNVKSRMKLYYGEEADLFIESKYKHYTRVTFILPIREG